MDLFDLSNDHQSSMARLREQNQHNISKNRQGTSADQCNLTLPDKPYEEQPSSEDVVTASDVGSGPPKALVEGLESLRDHPTLVMGVASDILFPAWQQREIAETLKAAGNRSVQHVELGEDVSLFGHDTFLLDLENIGGNLRRFLG